MTSLRTMWGTDLEKIREMGEPFAAYFRQEVGVFLNNGTIENVGKIYRLSRAGKLLADGIAAELFFPTPGE